MNTKPVIKKRQTTHIEFFQLCEWIKAAELGGVFSISQCAEKASAALGFPVPNSAIESAISATGVKLPDRPEHMGKRDPSADRRQGAGRPDAPPGADAFCRPDERHQPHRGLK